MDKKEYIMKWVGIVTVILILGWAMWKFLHYIPFYLPSYCVWGGIFVTIVGLVGIIVPIRKIGLKTRKHSIAVTLVGLLLVLINLFWPASIETSSGEHQRLDDFLPRFQCSEYHQTLVPVPADQLVDVIPKINLSDIPAIVLLMKIRSLFADESYQLENDSRPLLSFGEDSPFLLLDDSNPYELVFGMAGKPWNEEMAMNIRTAEQYMAFNQPGHVKVASNIRIVSQGDQSSLVTMETRILGNDKASQDLFARYWRVIYPGSSIIRRVWLNAIADKVK